MEQNTEKKHPAFGMAGFRRVTGGTKHMFGSSVECDHYIELEIIPGAEKTWNGHRKYTSAYGDPYIRVAFTPAQFAELLTTMNIGDGVPCTIRRIGRNKVEDIPDDLYENELDRQKAVFKDKMKNIEQDLDTKQKRVNELLAQPRLNKDEKKELREILDKGICEIKYNIPYYMENFDEATRNIVKEAKSEIDATVQQCVTDLGVKALGVEVKNKQVPVYKPVNLQAYTDPTEPVNWKQTYINKGWKWISSQDFFKDPENFLDAMDVIEVSPVDGIDFASHYQFSTIYEYNDFNPIKECIYQIGYIVRSSDHKIPVYVNPSLPANTNTIFYQVYETVIDKYVKDGWEVLDSKEVLENHGLILDVDAIDTVLVGTKDAFEIQEWKQYRLAPIPKVGSEPNEPVLIGYLTPCGLPTEYHVIKLMLNDCIPFNLGKIFIKRKKLLEAGKMFQVNREDYSQKYSRMGYNVLPVVNFNPDVFKDLCDKEVEIYTNGGLGIKFQNLDDFKMYLNPKPLNLDDPEPYLLGTVECSEIWVDPMLPYNDGNIYWKYSK